MPERSGLPRKADPRSTGNRDPRARSRTTGAGKKDTKKEQASDPKPNAKPKAKSQPKPQRKPKPRPKEPAKKRTSGTSGSATKPNRQDRTRRPASRDATKPARPATKAATPEAARWSRRRRTLVRVAIVVATVAVLGGFAYALARITLTPLPDSADQVTGNTSPGESLRFYLDRPSVRAAALQVGGNLALMSPLGALLPLVSARLAGVLRIGLIAGVISLTVELAQGTLIVGRSFDADDVILNTTGAVLAYLIVGRKLRRLLAARH